MLYARGEGQKWLHQRLYKAGEHFQKNFMSSVHMSVFTSIFSHWQAFKSEPVFPYVTTTVPWKNCPFLPCAALFWSHSCLNDSITITQDGSFHWRRFGCQPACPSLSIPPCQPLWSLLVFSFVSYSRQHSVSLIPSLYITEHFHNVIVPNLAEG